MTTDEINKKIASCKALQRMTVEDVIMSDRFRDNLAAYMTEQRETRNMAIRSYQAMHKLGGPTKYRLPAHPIDRVINQPVEDFRKDFMLIIGKKSARPHSEREYIRQLGQQAYNLTVAQFVVEEYPELSDILIPKKQAN